MSNSSKMVKCSTSTHIYYCCFDSSKKLREIPFENGNWNKFSNKYGLIYLNSFHLNKERKQEICGDNLTIFFFLKTYFLIKFGGYFRYKNVFIES